MMSNEEAAKPKRMRREETRAWRLMGLAFERLLRSKPPDRAERLQAVALAQWLYDNSLTEDERTEFMHQTGWIMDSELADELRAPDFPPTPANDQDDMPF